MKNYLATWFYLESTDDESFYPSVGKHTSSKKFQDYYWKCIYCFFESAYLTQYSDNIAFLFFTNANGLPHDLDGIDLNSYFTEHQIQIINLQLTNKTPKDWYNAWRNQFYLFDILSYCQKLDGNLIILDSDCFFRKPLAPIYQDIEKHNIVVYNCGHGIEQEINGITISQMRILYEDFFSMPADHLSYYGGEFIGISCSCIPNMLQFFYYLWDLNYTKYLNKEPKLNEEAHFLSLIYYRLGIRNSYADPYIRRIWTAIKYDNASADDCRLSIWHMPAEKKYGFQKMFKWLTKKRRTKDDFICYLDKFFFITKSKNYRIAKKFLYKIEELIS